MLPNTSFQLPHALYCALARAFLPADLHSSPSFHITLHQCCAVPDNLCRRLIGTIEDLKDLVATVCQSKMSVYWHTHVSYGCLQDWGQHIMHTEQAVRKASPVHATSPEHTLPEKLPISPAHRVSPFGAPWRMLKSLHCAGPAKITLMHMEKLRFLYGACLQRAKCVRVTELLL